MASNLPNLPWWDSEDSPDTLLAAIEAARQQLEGHQAMHMFSRRSLLAFVFMANKLEGTLPAGYDEWKIYQLLEEELDSTQGSEPQGAPTSLWPAEGGTSGTRQQLLQCLKAAKYLCWPLRTPLTVESICMAHKLMMWGAE